MGWGAGPGGSGRASGSRTRPSCGRRGAGAVAATSGRSSSASAAWTCSTGSGRDDRGPGALQMIKLIALLRRRPDVSREEFARYYEHEHAPLFAQSIPPEGAQAIRYYAQNHALQLGGGGDPPFDCVTQVD